MKSQDRAIIVYVPAVHNGYLKFFDEYVSDLYLLDTEYYAKILPYLERDIRSIPASKAVIMLRSIYKDRSIETINSTNLQTVLSKYSKFILPNEDVSHKFIDNNLMDSDYNLVDIFLRWDKNRSKSANVNINSKKTKEANHKERMNLIIETSKNSPDWWRQVGSSVYIDEKLILATYNKPYPSENYSLELFGDPRSSFNYGENIEISKCIHAEASLISEAAQKGISLNKAEMYITTFPCPNCAKLVANSGITKIFYKDGYSLLDAEEIFKTKGIDIVQVID